MNLIRTKTVHENLAHFNRLAMTGEPQERKEAERMVMTIENLISACVVKPRRLTAQERLKRDKMLQEIKTLEMNIEVYKDLATRNQPRKWKQEIEKAEKRISAIGNEIRKITQL